MAVKFYKQITIAVHDDDTETVESEIQFVPYIGAVEPPEPEDESMVAVVTSSYVNVRHAPDTNPPVAAQLKAGRQIHVKRVPTDYKGYDPKWVWWQIILGNGDSKELVGKFVAEKSADGNTVFLSITDEEIPEPETDKTLTGDIQIVTVESPQGIRAARFKVGNEAWSALPKIGVKTRSIIVARERIEQFHYISNGQDFYYQMPEQAYQEHMNQANNPTQTNPKPMNIADYGAFGPHREFNGDANKEARLIDLTEQFVDDLESRHMKLTLVLNDGLKHWHNYPIEDQYHTLGGDGRLRWDYYTDKAYELQMLPYVEKLAKRLGGHKALGYIQISNEDNIEGAPPSVADAYYEYVRKVRDTWRKYDTTSPIGLCIENTNKLRWMENGKMVANDKVVEKFAPLVDFWQAHMYANPNAKTIHDKWLEQDRVYDDLFRLALEHGLPPFLDETFIQHKNASQDVTNGTTDQAWVRWTDMLDKGLGKLYLWGYHQDSTDRNMADAQAFTNVLSGADKTGYKGYYDIRAKMMLLGHTVLPTVYNWKIVS